MSQEFNKENWTIHKQVWVVGAVAALGGLCFGYDIGGSGGTFVMEAFRRFLQWPTTFNDPGNNASGFVLGPTEEDEKGWITALFSIGCMVGAFPSGFLVDRLGRRLSLMLFANVFTIGATIQGFSSSLVMLYIGRFIGGMGIGSLSMGSTLYQSEMAPERIRGKLVTLHQLCITFGILLAALFNYVAKDTEIGWRFSYALNGFFSLFMAIFMIYLPETPRYLASKGDYEGATAILRRIRTTEEEVQVEIQEIREANEEAARIQAGKWSDLFSTKKQMRQRIFVGMGLQFLQQFTGINAIMYFAPDIFNRFFSSDDAILANMLITAVNFLATFLTIYAVEKTGRKKLLILGGVGMALTTGLVSLFSSPAFDYTESVGVRFAIIGFCALYVINFAYGWGPLVWVVCSEIFPQELRGKAMSLTTSTNWVTNFIIGKFTVQWYNPKALDVWGTFLLFAGFCTFMTLFVWAFLPETKGIPLEEMDLLFKRYKTFQIESPVKPHEKDEKN